MPQPPGGGDEGREQREAVITKGRRETHGSSGYVGNVCVGEDFSCVHVYHNASAFIF